MQSRFITILILALALVSGTANAQVYRWVDKDGKVHYGDTGPSDTPAKRLPGVASPPQSPQSPQQGTRVLSGKISAAGIFYLGDANVGIFGPSPFDNAAVDGLVLRTGWALTEPNDDAYDWSQIDLQLDAAKRTGKAFGLAVGAGFNSPKWFLDSGATKLTVTRINAATLAQSRVVIPVPWDATFQSKWGEFLQVVAARYDGQANLSYVVISGVGQSFEAIMVRTAEDIAAFEAAGGLPRWIEGTKAVIDLYATHFKNTPFLLSMQNPVVSAAGEQAIADVVNYGFKTYPGRFGVKYNALDALASSRSFFYSTISNWSTATTVGFQTVWSTTGAHADQMKGTLKEVLDRGIAQKGHFIEVYAADCDNPIYADDLKQASAGLRQNAAALK